MYALRKFFKPFLCLAPCFVWRLDCRAVSLTYYLKGFPYYWQTVIPLHSKILSLSYDTLGRSCSSRFQAWILLKRLLFTSLLPPFWPAGRRTSAKSLCGRFSIPQISTGSPDPISSSLLGLHWSHLKQWLRAHRDFEDLCHSMCLLIMR